MVQNLPICLFNSQHTCLEEQIQRKLTAQDLWSSACDAALTMPVCIFFSAFCNCITITTCVAGFQIFEIVNFTILCNTIALFGVVANIVNMIIFFKQGFTNTVNISFFSMAFSDLCCLITIMWVCACLNPFIISAGVPWVPEDIMCLIGAWPHLACGKITSYITVFITAERCLSIITPLKVKEIITPTRATVVISLIYILNILTFIPEYATCYLEYKFFPARNATLLAITFTSSRDAVTGLVYFMSSITSISSFVGVIVWTVILVVKLQQSSKWRQQASNDREGIMSSRDKKTIKMVAMIAIILIVCFTPGAVLGLAAYVVPEFKLGKRYVNLAIAMWSVSSVFQSVNSSVNIFLYYNMSSNYKRTFDKLFGRAFGRSNKPR